MKPANWKTLKLSARDLESFEEALSDARKAGAKTFIWHDLEFSTAFARHFKQYHQERLIVYRK